jgi:hypothetical protein
VLFSTINKRIQPLIKPLTVGNDVGETVDGLGIIPAIIQHTGSDLKKGAHEAGRCAW